MSSEARTPPADVFGGRGTAIVHDVLLSTSTRSALEQELCTRLVDLEPVELAWIGAFDQRGQLTRSCTGGDSGVLGDAAADFASVRPDEIARQAARDGESILERDFQQVPSLEPVYTAGIRSILALPLGYRDVQYGVLTVFGGTVDGFTRDWRRRLEEIADLAAYGLHETITRQAHASGQPTLLKVRVRDPSHPLVALLSDERVPESAAVDVHRTHRMGDGAALALVTIDSLDPAVFTAVAEDCPEIRAMRTVGDPDGEPSEFELTVTTPTVSTLLMDIGCPVRSLTVTPSGVTVGTAVPADQRIRAVLHRLADRYTGVDLTGVVSDDGVTPSVPTTESVSTDGDGRLDQLLEDLTDRQTMALELATRHGYFERPRRHTATEIADRVDLTHTTFLAHLRAAERTVFERLLAEVTAADEAVVGGS